jgi:arylsulfatase A-like enzyme
VSPSPWTLPSHASLFTGLFPSEHNVTEESLYLDNKVITVAEILREKGYNTIGFSSNDWVSRSTNLTKDFKTFYESSELSSNFYFQNDVLNKVFHKWKIESILERILSKTRFKHSITEKVLNLTKSYIKKYSKSEEPFFIFMNFMDAHLPYYPKKKYLEMFLPSNATGERIKYLRDNFRQCRVQIEKLSRADFEILNSLYDGEIAFLDSKIGEIIAFLHDKKLLDGTLVILTSDHGENIGDHGLMNHWLCLYDTLIRVPMIIRYPKLFPSKIVKHQIQTTDIFYTILDIIKYNGNSVSKEIIKRHSLLNKIKGFSKYEKYTFSEDTKPGRVILKEIQRYNPNFRNKKLESAKKAIRGPRYKYISYECGIEELFDIKSDPNESKNIIKEKPEELRILKNKLEEWSSKLTKVGDKRSANKVIDEFEEAAKNRLKVLGYL